MASGSIRAKAILACDTCRRRKSRCDGARPKCTHCRASGVDCIYRPTASVFETDLSVLTRLSDVEARIDALECRSPSHATPMAPGRRKSTALMGPPNLHTAASYKMLDGWPRLRLHLQQQDIRPMAHLKEIDSADPVLVSTTLHDSHAPHLPAGAILRTIEHTYRNAHELPPSLAYLFACSPNCYPENGTANLTGDPAHSIKLHSLSLEQLLLLSIGLGSLDDLPVHDCDAAALLEACFALVMQRQWLLYSKPEVQNLGILLAMAICLLHFWGRPYHCLGLLQSLGPLINHLALINRNDESSMECIKAYTLIHCVLESDILTELDAFPSQSQHTLNRYWPTPFDTTEVESNIPTGENDITPFIQGHLFLRDTLNRILHDLYSPDNANAAPHELGDLVDSYSTKLRQWSRGLPFDHQFARDITTFTMSRQSLSLRQRELALRYFSCVFLLHRPVLYFYLHKELEYTIRPPDPVSVNLDNVPWVHESCRDCTESAALIVYMHHMRLDIGTDTERSYYNWCDVQLLFAVYLVLLQSKPVPTLTNIFQDPSEVDRLLDMVEMVLERVPFESLTIKNSLMLLRTERRGFESGLH